MKVEAMSDAALKYKIVFEKLKEAQEMPAVGQSLSELQEHIREISQLTELLSGQENEPGKLYTST